MSKSSFFSNTGSNATAETNRLDTLDASVLAAQAAQEAAETAQENAENAETGTLAKFNGIQATAATGAAGSNASVSYTDSNTTFDFTLPRGDSATVAVGTVTTGSEGSSATVTNSGTTSDAVFDFSIPVGATATTIDGLSSSAFLRSDAADTKTIGDLSFSDNVKLILGDGNDLEISSNGSSGVIKNTQGTLRIQNSLAGEVSDIEFYTGGTSASNRGFVVGGNAGGITAYFQNAQKFQVNAVSTDIEDILNVEGGTINLKTDSGSQAELRMYCESSNAHYAAIQAPAHSDFSGNVTLTMPATTGTIALEGQAYTSILDKGSVNTHTAALSDAGKLIKFDTANAVTVTIPANSSVAFPIGTRIDLLQNGVGQITVAGATGVTINATPTLKTRTQFSAASCIQLSANLWLLTGDLALT